VVIAVIRKTAKNIVTPSIQPVEGFLIIPKIVEMIAAISKTCIIKSPKHSRTKVRIGVNGLLIGILEPYFDL